MFSFFTNCELRADLNEIIQLLRCILASKEELAAALSGIRGDLSALASGLGDVNTGIDKVLAALLAAQQGSLSQAELNAAVADAQALDAAGEDVKAAVEAAKAKLGTVA